MKTQRKSFVIALLAMLWCNISPSFAQNREPDAKLGEMGRDFWLCFPQNARYEIGSLRQTIIVTAVENAEVVVSRHASGVQRLIIQTKLLKAGESHVFDLDTSLQCFTSEKIEDKGVHVGSTGNITVVASSMRKASGDTYRIMPTDQLGNKYMIVGYDPPAADPTFTTQLNIVAIEDNTSIVIALSALTVGDKSKNDQIAITLSKGQTYTVKGGYKSMVSGDLTGTVITSNNPIAVMTGHTCAQVPSRFNFCDVLVEMAPPISTFGKDFVVPAMKEKGGYALRIVAAEANTIVNAGGTALTIQNSGGHQSLEQVAGHMRVTSDKPVMVAQYAQSFDADSVKIGDPFMMMIAPTDRFGSSALLTTPLVSGSWWQTANIVCDENAARTLKINGRAVDKTFASAVDGSDLIVYQVNLEPGTKQIKSDGRIAVYSYGFGFGGDNFDSYGTYVCAW